MGVPPWESHGLFLTSDLPPFCHGNMSCLNVGNLCDYCVSDLLYSSSRLLQVQCLKTLWHPWELRGLLQPGEPLIGDTDSHPHRDPDLFDHRIFPSASQIDVVCLNGNRYNKLYFKL